MRQRFAACWRKRPGRVPGGEENGGCGKPRPPKPLSRRVLKIANSPLPTHRGADQFAGVNAQGSGDLPQHRDACRDGGALDRAEIADARPGALGQVLRSQPLAWPTRGKTTGLCVLFFPVWRAGLFRPGSRLRLRAIRLGHQGGRPAGRATEFKDFKFPCEQAILVGQHLHLQSQIADVRSDFFGTPVQRVCVPMQHERAGRGA